MRLKLFRAAGMPQAMAEIRAELGLDALILSSRRIAGGIEVTAASEAEADIPALAQLSEQGREAALAHHGIPAVLASKLMAGPLPLALAVTLRFKAIPTDRGSPPLHHPGRARR